MSDAPPPADDGIPASLRRLGTSLHGLIRTRLELFAVELREEQLRAVGTLLWVAVALSLLAGGLLVVVGTLALVAWNLAAYTGLVVLALGLIVVAILLLWIIIRGLQQGPKPFSETVAEFQRDFKCSPRE